MELTMNNKNKQKTIKALNHAINLLQKKHKKSDTEDLRELLNLMFQLIEVS